MLCMIHSLSATVCGSCPLVAPYSCRLGDLLYIICVVSFVLIIVHVYVCVKLFTFFDLYFVYFLQYSDTVDWVFWPVKTVGRITYIVLAQTLNHAQPTNHQRQSTSEVYCKPLCPDWVDAFACFGRYYAFLYCVQFGISLDDISQLHVCKHFKSLS